MWTGHPASLRVLAVLMAWFPMVDSERAKKARSGRDVSFIRVK